MRRVDALPGRPGRSSSRRALRRNSRLAIGIRYISVVHHHPSHSFIVPYLLFILSEKVVLRVKKSSTPPAPPPGDAARVSAVGGDDSRGCVRRYRTR